MKDWENEPIDEFNRTLVPYSWAFSPVLGDMYGIIEALLIQQVHYRAQFDDKPKVRDGHQWTYNSQREWSEKIKVASLSTVGRALNKLVELNVLVQGNYNKKKYDTTRWYRVNYPVLQEAMRTHLGVVVESVTTRHHVVNLTTWDVQNESTPPKFTTPPPKFTCPIPKTPPKNPPKKKINKKKIQAGEIPGEKTGESEPEKIHEVEIVEKYIPVEIDIKEPPVKKSASSHKAILESLKVANGTSTAKVSNTPASVTHLWRTLVPVYHKSTGMMPEIPMLTKGQLGQISRALGSRADAVVECVIKEWVSYSKYVAAQTGLKIAPESPHVGFLLKNVGLASFFSESRLQLIAKPNPKPPKQDTITPKSGTMSVACDLEDEEDGTIWKPSS